jgi:SAM-dependent methyltransferase
VLATDVDTARLDELAAPNIEVRRHDIAHDDLPADGFDLVHCRALLVHLDDPDQVVPRMVGWLRPGGVLVAEEPWLDVGLLAPDPEIARAARGLTRRMDSGLARRLPMLLRESGLREVEADGRLRAFTGGSAPAGFCGLALEGAADRLAAAGELDPAASARIADRFRDPEWIEFGWPRIAAWGRRPA